MIEVFLDTTYAIALSNQADAFHQKAVQLADQIEAAGIFMVTTQLVLVKISNALSRQQHHEAAVSLLESIDTDPNIEIIPLSESIYHDAYKLFSNHADKQWDMVDCISFVVMREHGIKDALTTNPHFQQMGYCSLLRD
ncbi:MAG: PIN domain-containing protein [Gloeobacterales cyanobacterium]